jgi:hypothetical protein
MHKKTSNKEFTSLFRDAALKTKSWHSVMRNNWRIKFSIHNTETIMVFISCTITHRSYVRFFSVEDEAVQFINFVVNLD